MKYNLEHFSEVIEKRIPEKAKEIGYQAEMLYSKLTAYLSKDISSPEIQSFVHEADELFQVNGGNISPGNPYLNIIFDTYSNDFIKATTDTKYGKGASDYIVKAFRYCLENECSDMI